MIKALLIFYVILAVAWSITSYKEPKEKSGPGVTRREMPKGKPFSFPAGYADTNKKLASIFASATEIFDDGNVPVLALPPFTMDNESPELLTLLTESAFFYLSNDKNVRVVRRDYSAGGSSRIKPKHILIGKVGEIGRQLRITVRIQDVNSGEILDVFDEYIRKADVAKFL